MTKEDVIALALEFRAAGLWKELDDSMLFGVRMPDGDVGYCCVMGNNGEHYALALYRGRAGFTSYINTVIPQQGAEVLEMFSYFDCINCDFENASQANLTAEQKRLIRAVAAERGIKMCRSNGYPEILRYYHGSIRTRLNDDETQALGMALKGGLEVARRLKGMSSDEISGLGFANDGYFPYADGSATIPMLEPKEDGGFEWTSIRTPAAMASPNATPKLKAPLVIGKLKAMPQQGDMQIKVMRAPMLVDYKEGTFYPLMMVLINDDGMAYPVMQKSEEPHAEEDLLCQLLYSLLSLEVYPEVILVDDSYSEAFLEDFCRKTDIALVREVYLPELREVAHIVRNELL